MVCGIYNNRNMLNENQFGIKEAFKGHVSALNGQGMEVFILVKEI
jgi:hypothetical protein